MLQTSGSVVGSEVGVEVELGSGVTGVEVTAPQVVVIATCTSSIHQPRLPIDTSVPIRNRKSSDSPANGARSTVTSVKSGPLEPVHAARPARGLLPAVARVPS